MKLPRATEILEGMLGQGHTRPNLHVLSGANNAN